MNQDVYEKEREKCGKDAPENSVHYERLLFGTVWSSCLAFLDDNWFFFLVQTTFRLLEVSSNRSVKVGFILNPKKCNFGRKNVQILGNDVSLNGVLFSSATFKLSSHFRALEQNRN